LAARKAQGVRLRNPRNAGEAAAAGRRVLSEDADAFAVNVLPIINSLRVAGVRDLRGLVEIYWRADDARPAPAVAPI
jgi:limonene-1,2-epoxide hydrolase